MRPASPPPPAAGARSGWRRPGPRRRGPPRCRARGRGWRRSRGRPPPPPDPSPWPRIEAQRGVGVIRLCPAASCAKIACAAEAAPRSTGNEGRIEAMISRSEATGPAAAACLALVVLALPAMAQRKPEPKRDAKAGVRLVVDEAAREVDVLVDGRPFTSYIWPTTIKKPVLYPIRAATGQIVTRGFPR